jgi:hypothetical protein
MNINIVERFLLIEYSSEKILMEYNPNNNNKTSTNHKYLVSTNIRLYPAEYINIVNIMNVNLFFDKTLEDLKIKKNARMIIKMDKTENDSIILKISSIS